MVHAPRYYSSGGHGRSLSRDPDHAGEYVSRRQHQREVNRPLPAPRPREQTPSGAAQQRSREQKSIELSSNRKNAVLYVNGVRQQPVGRNRWHLTTVPKNGSLLPFNLQMMAGPDDGESTTKGATLIFPGQEVFELRPVKVQVRGYWECHWPGWVPALSAFLSEQLDFEPLWDIVEDVSDPRTGEGECRAEHDSDSNQDFLKIYGYWERLPSFVHRA